MQIDENVSSAEPRRKSGRLAAVIQWFDSDYSNGSELPAEARNKIEWVRCVPFIVLHVGCLGVFLFGWSWFAVGAAAALYFLRMFAVTGFYHRYFSHRTFKTSRWAQFLFAAWGASAAQRGALWWAGHHRHHHRHSDQEEDMHSPGRRGFWWSHMGWIVCSKNFRTDYTKIKDFAKFPELVFLNRFDSLIPALLAGAIFGIGCLLERYAPGLGTNGPQLLVWAFFISTTALFNFTGSINSLAHIIGKRRFKTDDDSRNSLLLALATMGEGWHNNHHHYMHSTRQGFYWWEIDLTYYMLRLLESVGLIWNLRPVPAEIYEQARKASSAKTNRDESRHDAPAARESRSQERVLEKSCE